MRLALYQPDIPQNTGAILRLGAAQRVPVEIIEPCGFVWSEPRLQRAGMDYIELAAVTRHQSWQRFRETRPERLVLLTTQAAMPFTDFAFATDDILLLGRESAGVPPEIHRAAAARIVIPMAPGARSLNVALAAAMVLGEALRQTDSYPTLQREEAISDGY